VDRAGLWPAARRLSKLLVKPRRVGYGDWRAARRGVGSRGLGPKKSSHSARKRVGSQCVPALLRRETLSQSRRVFHICGPRSRASQRTMPQNIVARLVRQRAPISPHLARFNSAQAHRWCTEQDNGQYDRVRSTIGVRRTNGTRALFSSRRLHRTVPALRGAQDQQESGSSRRAVEGPRSTSVSSSCSGWTGAWCGGYQDCSGAKSRGLCNVGAMPLQGGENHTPIAGHLPLKPGSSRT